MTTIPQPDFVGRLLGDGAELAVRPLLPSLFDPVPAPEPSPEPVARESFEPEPGRPAATAEPEAVVPKPSAPRPVALEAPKLDAVRPTPRHRTVPEQQAPEPKAIVPRRAPEAAAPRLPLVPRTEAIATAEPPAPTKSSRRNPVATTAPQPKEVPVPVVQQIEKTVVQQGISTVIPIVEPITPVAPAAQPQRPVAPRRSKAVEQTVHITIGRVEVKAAADKAPERRAAPRRQPTTSLEDYLRSRGGGAS